MQEGIYSVLWVGHARQMWLYLFLLMHGYANAGGRGLRQALTPQAQRALIRSGSKRAEALEALTAQVAELQQNLQVSLPPPVPNPPPPSSPPFLLLLLPKLLYTQLHLVCSVVWQQQTLFRVNLRPFGISCWHAYECCFGQDQVLAGSLADLTCA